MCCQSFSLVSTCASSSSKTLPNSVINNSNPTWSFHDHPRGSKITQVSWPFISRPPRWFLGQPRELTLIQDLAIEPTVDRGPPWWLQNHPTELKPCRIHQSNRPFNHCYHCQPEHLHLLQSFAFSFFERRLVELESLLTCAFHQVPRVIFVLLLSVDIPLHSHEVVLSFF